MILELIFAFSIGAGCIVLTLMLIHKQRREQGIMTPRKRTAFPDISAAPEAVPGFGEPQGLGQIDVHNEGIHLPADSLPSTTLLGNDAPPEHDSAGPLVALRGFVARVPGLRWLRRRTPSDAPTPRSTTLDAGPW